MYVCYYFLKFLRDDEVGNDTFWHHWLFASMPFAKEGKILIKILFSIKDYNVKDLVKKFPSKDWNVGLVYKSLQKLWIAGSVGHHPAAADDAAPAQLITLNLFTNCYHTKVSKREIIFAHCT